LSQETALLGVLVTEDSDSYVRGEVLEETALFGVLLTRNSALSSPCHKKQCFDIEVFVTRSPMESYVRNIMSQESNIGFIVTRNGSPMLEHSSNIGVTRTTMLEEESLSQETALLGVLVTRNSSPILEHLVTRTPMLEECHKGSLSPESDLGFLVTRNSALLTEATSKLVGVLVTRNR